MLLKRESDPRSFALINMLMDHEKREEGKVVRDKQVVVTEHRQTRQVISLLRIF